MRRLSMGTWKFVVFFVAIAWLTLACATATASEWPCYKGDAARSGVTDEELTLPLVKLWRYEPSQPPRPAWPEPGKEVHRLDFDYAPQPVVAGGMVYFGTSSDDSVRALDAATGAVKWRFTTGGPVRLAPHIWDRKCYVTSDDGFLYCLDAATGELTWKFHAAPGNRKMLGNGRMISRWPCRSGALVVDGVVYVTAGMWPSEGVYLYALDAQTGEQLWCNTTNLKYRLQPHGGSSAFTGVCPQGYMLASDDMLMVPSGRATPGVYNRRSGELIYYQPYLYLEPYGDENWGNRANGGAWITIAGDVFFNPVHTPGAPDIDVHLGESPPRPGDGMGVWSLQTGRKKLTLPGKYRVLVAGGILYAVGNGELQAIDLKAWRQSGKLEGCVKWTVPQPRSYSIAMAGHVLLLGARGTLSGFDSATGRQVWQADLDGQVRGIAVAEGRVMASTSKGEVVCFAGRAPSTQPISVRERLSWDVGALPQAESLADELISACGVTQGYALLIGQADSRLALALASKTDLRVISVIRGEERAAAERQKLMTTDMYGYRVAVEAVDDLDKLPFANYFADLVVVSGDARSLSGGELYRMLQPCGGVMCFPGMAQKAVERLITEAGAPEDELSQSDGRLIVTRGALAGSGEWRCQWANAGNTGIGGETRLHLPLELLWFGGPGPERILSRHLRPSAPLFVNGRCFITGQNHVIAFDAYNGRQLWCTELPGAARKASISLSGNFVADDESLYVAVGACCQRLDQRTGKTLRVYTIPEELLDQAKPQVQEPAEWGYVAAADGLVLGTVLAEPKSPECSALFALNQEDGSVRWTRRPDGRFYNTGLAIGEGRLYSLDATSTSQMGQAARRGQKVKPRQSLVAFDLHTGRKLWRSEDVPAGLYELQYAKGVVALSAKAAYDAATGKNLWQKNVPYQRPPLILGDWIIAQPFAYDLRTGEPRTAPTILGDEEQRWRFNRAYGCGPVVGCPGLLMFRSGTFGFYDFARDGTTNFGGARPGCAVNMIPAGGLVLAPESSSGCSCSYNFQTSLALTPCESDRNLWFVFGNKTTGAGIGPLHLNLGAPGDRRAAEGLAWLAYPRPLAQWARSVSASPVDPALHSYHHPEDLPRLAGGERPWLYTSGIEGAGALTLRPLLPKQVYIPLRDDAPTIDAKLDDPCWQKAEPLPFVADEHLLEPRVTLLACRDEEAVYFAYRRTAPLRDGQPAPFVCEQTGADDAHTWEDDHVEFFLADKEREYGIQLGVSCGGGRFEGLSDIPQQAYANLNWDGEWSCEVERSATEWTAELAIPYAMLRKAHMDPDTLAINVRSGNLSGVGKAQIYLQDPGQDFGYCQLFCEAVRSPPLPPGERVRPCTVRLHFAELQDVAPGERVFDVKLQGRTVLKDFDIMREAGARFTPIIREFRDIPVGTEFSLELIPGNAGAAPPCISGIELIQQGSELSAGEG